MDIKEINKDITEVESWKLIILFWHFLIFVQINSLLPILIKLHLTNKCRTSTGVAHHTVLPVLVLLPS